MNKKIEQFLFYLLLFCLPLQTRLLIYAPNGDFVEWSSVFFYLTDGLILLLLASWAVGYCLGQRMEKFKFSFVDYCLGVFLVFVGLSVCVAVDKTLAVYHWLRLLELGGLFYFVKVNWQKINWLMVWLMKLWIKNYEVKKICPDNYSFNCYFDLGHLF